MVDYEKLANGGIPRLKPYQAGKPIEEVQRELGLTKVIKLASNENPYGMSKKAIEACKEALEKVNYYPDSHGFYIKKKLCEKFNFKEECITLGDGSNELINLIFQAYVNDKVNVVIPDLSFIVYQMEATVANANIKKVELTNYVVDTDKVLAAIDVNTRAVVITNPANPTGTCIDTKVLHDFVKKVPKETLVILDEAYREFQDDTSLDTASFVNECENVIVCRTFSKAYGLAGLRIGYMISNPTIASVINRLRAPFNVNQVAQIAAINALDDTEHLNYVVKQNKIERDRYAKYCQDHGFYMIPSQTNFVSIDFKFDAMPLYDKLLHQGVIVRPMKGYGLDTILRVSIGTHEENTMFFETLDKILEEMR